MLTSDNVVYYRSLLRAAATNNIDLLEESLNPDLGPVLQSDIDEAFVKVATLGHLHCAERLVNAGADLNGVDCDDDTPLILATINNHYGKKYQLLHDSSICYFFSKYALFVLFNIALNYKIMQMNITHMKSENI